MNEVFIMQDYFPHSDDLFWVHVYDVKDNVVYFNIADKDWTKGEMDEKEFLSKYYLVED